AVAAPAGGGGGRMAPARTRRRPSRADRDAGGMVRDAGAGARVAGRLRQPLGRPPCQGHGGPDPHPTPAPPSRSGSSEAPTQAPRHARSSRHAEGLARPPSVALPLSVLSGAASASRLSRAAIATASARLRAPRRSRIDSMWLFTVLVARWSRAA